MYGAHALTPVSLAGEGWGEGDFSYASPSKSAVDR